VDFEELRTRYIAGASVQELSVLGGYPDAPGFSVRSLGRKLYAAGVLRAPSIRRGGPEFTLDEGFFDELTPDALYWIGFLGGDGCVSGKRISLRLASVDHGHIEKFRAALGSSTTVKTGITKPNYIGTKLVGPKGYSYIHIRSKKLADSLAAYGITPRKSRTLRLSDDIAQSKDVYRGLLDADGHIAVRHTKACAPGTLACTKYGYKARTDVRLSLLGSEFVIQQFKDNVQSVEPAVNNKICRRGNIFSFEVGGERAKRLVGHFYEGATTFLDRKMSTAQEIMAAKLGVDTTHN
jgi:hypothetical protein